MSDKRPLTEGKVRGAQRGFNEPTSQSHLRPVRPPPSSKSKKCCGQGCHLQGEVTTSINAAPDKDNATPDETNRIHSDTIFSVFAMISLASAFFGMGLVITLFSIGMGAPTGIIVIGLASVTFGVIGIASLWSVIAENINDYKKSMKEED